MKMENKMIRSAQIKKDQLSQKYNVPISSIVWIGNNHYIVVKDGNEIRI